MSNNSALFIGKETFNRDRFSFFYNFNLNIVVQGNMATKVNSKKGMYRLL